MATHLRPNGIASDAQENKIVGATEVALYSATQPAPDELQEATVIIFTFYNGAVD